ncbi:MAG: hypothetical protein U0350_06680 [Caldilineaceae bacterium]
MIATNTVFSDAEIVQAAKRNAHLFCFTNVVCAKAHGLSPHEYWTFIGQQSAAFWAQEQSVSSIARRAARNMVSVGATLQALADDESQAEAVMTGWPAPDTTAHFGLTQAEADAVFDIFSPIAASLGCRYQWQRRGDAIIMTFRKP